MDGAAWDLAGHPAHFGRHGDDLVPLLTDDPSDLPEVAAAREQGYFPAHEAPLWCFIPAIWPTADRAWIRDRRIRQLTRRTTAEPMQRIPWSAADYAEIDADANHLLAEVGIPPRPPGRIWLLRPPTPYPTLQAVLDHIWDEHRAHGGESMLTPDLVTTAVRLLRNSRG